MQRIFVRAALVAALFVSARPASAQVQVQVQGLAGVTDAAEKAPVFAGALGIKITAVEFDFEVGRFNNLLPSDILDRIHDLEEQHGLPQQSVISVPGTYFTGSVRVIRPNGFVQPFGSAGIGAVRLNPQLSINLSGVSLPDVFGQVNLGSQTDTMLVFGGGLRFNFHVVNVEGGYRYIGIFSHLEATTNFDRDRVLTTVQTVYGAIAFRF
jgi:hypothetical protein